MPFQGLFGMSRRKSLVVCQSFKKYGFPTAVYNEILKEVKEDIDYFSNFSKNKDTQFNNSVWAILVESEIKGICEHKEAEKQLIFLNNIA